MFSMAVAGLVKSLIVVTASLHSTAAPPAHYTVRPGDTLSSIAAANNVTWEQLWSDNRAAVADPNLIYPGQVFSVGGATVTAAAYPGHPGHPGQDGGDQAPAAPAAPEPAPQPAAQQAPASSAGGSGSGVSSGFQACVIARESGGNAQVMNSSGHYGLYQFSASTWAAYGGNPSTFGHASVAEQNQVFSDAMATPGGASNWSPYDGC
jgi:Tfp pilus assembly protein FimV